MRSPEQTSVPHLPAVLLSPVRNGAMGLLVALLCLICWAVFAPLATTVRASGVLMSSKPSFNIQHPYNARLKTVKVKLHDPVIAGQILYELDVSSQQKALRELRSAIHHFEAENRLITGILDTGGMGSTENGDDVPEVIKRNYAEMLENLDLEVAIVQQASQSIENRLAFLDRGLDLLQERQALMADRAEHLSTLKQKGLIAAAQNEVHTNQLLDLQEELIRAETERSADLATLRRNEIDRQSYKTRFRLTLLNKRLSNEARLPDLRRAAATIEDEVAQARIKAPVAGDVVAIGFDTDGLYAPRGTTLLTIAQPLELPFVEITIPPQAIDQTRPGMKGVLTISSLPQRNMPKIKVTLETIARDALLDPAGTPIGYRGRAIIDQQDLTRVRQSMGDALSLSADMPVEVALEGRHITFWQYLIDPFFQIFKESLQD